MRRPSPLSAWRHATLILAVVLQQAAADERISQAAFKQLFAAGTVVIVDTRAEAEFIRGHLPGALSITEAALTSRTPTSERTIDTLRQSNVPVVVYCACPAEITSLRVAKLLRDQGVADARALTGGWADWFNAGNPVQPPR